MGRPVVRLMHKTGASAIHSAAHRPRGMKPERHDRTTAVISAQAGIQDGRRGHWIPAFAGMTMPKPGVRQNRSISRQQQGGQLSRFIQKKINYLF